MGSSQSFFHLSHLHTHHFPRYPPQTPGPVFGPLPRSAPSTARFSEVLVMPITPTKQKQEQNHGHHCILSFKIFLIIVPINLQQVQTYIFLCILECTVFHYPTARRVTPYWITNYHFYYIQETVLFLGIFLFFFFFLAL